MGNSSIRNNISRRDRRAEDLQVARDQALGRVLLLLTREVSRRAVERMAAAGFGDISLGHFMIMAHIPIDGRRASEIAQRAGLTKQAVSKTVEELKRKGYVETAADPSDGRARIVTFTQRGLDMFEAGVAAGEAVEAEMAALLPAGDYERLKRSLVRLREASGA